MVFVVQATGERITVREWRRSGSRMVARIEFADGTVWQGESLDVDTLTGTDGDDALYGQDHRSETLVGGRGNDRLHGGGGSDTYVWNPGDGSDVIEDYAWGQDVNVLRFGPGVGLGCFARAQPILSLLLYPPDKLFTLNFKTSFNLSFFNIPLFKSSFIFSLESEYQSFKLSKTVSSGIKGFS